MRAAYVDELGPPSNIRCGELPSPDPGPSDVLVRVSATPVNPVDTLVRSGAFRTPVRFPFVIGRDLAGTVAATGVEASGFAQGERVWCNSLGHGGRQGAAAEWAAVPVDRLYHLPDDVRMEDAAAMVHPAATAYLALFLHGRLRPAETVVVAGAAGNVGSALVVLAVDAGARVLATASTHDAAYCRELGAAEVLDYGDPDLWRHLGERCPDGVDLLVDTSGTNDLVNGVDLLAERGRIVLLAGPRNRPELPTGKLYMKSGSVVGFVISGATGAELAQAAGDINRLLAAGELRARAAEEWPLSSAAEVHERMERGELHGRRAILLPGAG